MCHCAAGAIEGDADIAAARASSHLSHLRFPSPQYHQPGDRPKPQPLSVLLQQCATRLASGCGRAPVLPVRPSNMFSGWWQKRNCRKRSRPQQRAIKRRHPSRTFRISFSNTPRSSSSGRDACISSPWSHSACVAKWFSCSGYCSRCWARRRSRSCSCSSDTWKLSLRIRISRWFCTWWLRCSGSCSTCSQYHVGTGGFCSGDIRTLPCTCIASC